VRGSNNLRRTNWFNGRYLTAEALSRQDVYFDARLRLAAHAQMPGIAWGLGITAGANATPVTANPAAAACRPASPHPAPRAGLRPRRPPDPGLGALHLHHREAPRRLAQDAPEGGRRRRRFHALRVPRRRPAGPTGGSAVPSGPYLLVIQPNESEEGGAKVMGEICGGAAAVNCRADTWRGGFGLSLVRFPVELPLRQDLVSAWDLRGTLSAYFFDVFEHPLWKRWDRTSSPRAPSAATPGRAATTPRPSRWRWSTSARTAACSSSTSGSPPHHLRQPRRRLAPHPLRRPARAAAWARIHQFQCMLAESLAKGPRQRAGRSL
jgi:hypothetical protein